MYHGWGAASSSSSSSSYYSISQNGKTNGPSFLPSQPELADAFLGLPPPSLPSSYPLLQHPYYSQPQLHPQASLMPQVSTPSVLAVTPPFRRVLSTGDLEEEEAPRAMPMAGRRYSAEERRERIEKYRSKRSHRNFDKKITYACRKTLADSRPRVKGRFARNSGDAELTEAEAMSDAGTCDRNIGAGDPDAVHVVPEWWPAVQEALACRQEEQEAEVRLCDTDADELLAAYLGVSSMNLYSPRGQ